MRKHILAAALFIAAALPAAAQQNLELCRTDDINRITGNLAMADNILAGHISSADQRAGRYDCGRDLARAQACVRYARAIEEVSFSAEEVFREVTVRGCYDCDPQKLWWLAYELKARAEQLRAEGVYDEGRILAADSGRRIMALPFRYFYQTQGLYDAMQTARVKGVEMCPAGGFDPTAASTRGTGQAAGMSDDPGTAPPSTLPLDPSIAPPAGLAPATGTPPQQRCSAPQSYEDRRLNSGFGWVIDNMDFAACAQTCSDKATCTGYDYNWSAGRCVIRSEAMGAVGLEQIGGWTHYECQ